MNPNVPIPDSKQLTAYCQENDILKLAIYGSAQRDDFGPDSDIDLLVKFRPGARVGLFRVAGMEKALSAFFGERKIDLRTLGDLSPYIRSKVLSEARILVDLSAPQEEPPEADGSIQEVPGTIDAHR